MPEQNIQWHPGFYAGMQLEFRAYKLSFETEHQLTRGPLEIDLLIIKKLSDEIIHNEIGSIFRRHNIVEFKSPADELSVDVFFKVQAYACLYKSAGEQVNGIPAEDITVSLFRDSYPREMIRQLEAFGITASQPYPGIYYFGGKGFFPTQLVVTSELPLRTHSALKIISDEAREEDVIEFIRLANTFTSQGDRNRVDSVFQVSSTANRELYEKIYKEDPAMCQTLMDIMKDDIDIKVQQGRNQGIQQGIQIGKDDMLLTNINSLMESLNISASRAMEILHISPEDRLRYLSLFEHNS